MDMNGFIGQRFNLISKSDIRYVGTLNEINPEASTIALENVVSHGTEGRRGNPIQEIPPSANVYEYIVFRGSDVKDITVAEDEPEAPPQPQMPNDPAILGSARPGPPPGPSPSLATQFPGPRPPPGYPQPPFPGYFNPYNQRFAPPGFPPGFAAMPYGAPPGWFPPPTAGFPQGPNQFPTPAPMPIGPPPRQMPFQRPSGPPGPPGSQTPQPPSKPSTELPVGEKPPSKIDTPVSSATPVLNNKAELNGASNAKPQPTPPAKPATPSVAPIPPSSKPQTAASAVAVPAIPSSAIPPPQMQAQQQTQPQPSQTPAKSPQSRPQPQTQSPAQPPAAPAAQSSVQGGRGNNAMQEAALAASAAVNAAMAKLDQSNKGHAEPDPSVDDVSKKMSVMKTSDGERRPRGRARGHRGGGKKMQVPATDFDFESANAKFNKEDLARQAGAGSPDAEGPADGEVSTPSALGSNLAPPTAAYSKASFFDNISSESRDREEGTGGRIGREWRGEEERRNIETFGQGSVDGGYRGGFRGRGRGRGYGRGRSGFRGSGRRAFRGPRGAPSTGIAPS